LPLPHVDQSLAEIDRAAALPPVAGCSVAAAAAVRELGDTLMK
jgi:hypothetical protein